MNFVVDRAERQCAQWQWTRALCGNAYRARMFAPPLSPRDRIWIGVHCTKFTQPEFRHVISTWHACVRVARTYVRTYEYYRFSGERFARRLPNLMANKRPLWAESLDAKGTYYEGVVDDAQTVITQHSNDTITTFGTRTSRKTTKVGYHHTNHNW